MRSARVRAGVGASLSLGHIHPLAPPAGRYGRLGVGDHGNIHTPRIVVNGLQSKRVTQVACGTFHTMAITEDGVVLSWGFGGNGRLGHGDLKHRLVPKAVQLMHGRGVTGASSSLLQTGMGKSDVEVDADAQRVRLEARVRGGGGGQRGEGVGAGGRYPR